MDSKKPESDALPPTAWTLIQQVGVGAPTAMGQFLTLYRRAMVTHLVIRQHWQWQDAEDLVQGFILDKIMARNLVAAAQEQMGRFRDFLLTALDNYARERRRAAATKKRRVDTAEPLEEHLDLPDRHDQRTAVEAAWARDLLTQCLDSMKRECQGTERARIFDIFDCRVLTPALTGIPPLPYGELVKRFGLANPTQAANALVTAKRTFERHLRNAIRQYTGSESEIDTEIQELFHALSQAR